MKNPDYIDLKELNNLPIRKQIEIKIKIIENNELDNIPVAYLPAVFVDEYYFISYSHLDYKKVYKDIFELQASGLNTWYDRGIPANKSWKDTAKKYILPYACKGVIFYISENSLKSNPVKDEIEYVIDSHKPFIVIVLPTIIDNQEVNLLPSKIADKLYKEQKIDQERYDFIKKIFTDERIYLSLSTLTTNKVEKIKMALPEEPLLMMDAAHSHIDFFDRNSFGEAIIIIRSLRDYYCSKITQKDFLTLLESPILYKQLQETKNIDSYYRLKSLQNIQFDLDSAAFANMINLEYFEYPIAKPMNIIKDYTFMSCDNLKEIKFIKTGFSHPYIGLGKGCFKRCVNLQSIDCSNVVELKDECFDCCKSLTELDLHNVNKEIPKSAFSFCLQLKRVSLGPRITSIGDFAFLRTALEEITLPEELLSIKESAFFYCGNLKKINFNNKLQTIGECAFCGDESLREINLPDSVISIGMSAFANCLKLTNIKLSNNLEIIENRTFERNYYLKKVLFPHKLKAIKREAFTYCGRLKEIHLPETLESIEPDAFGKCLNLMTIYYDGTADNFLKINKNRFVKGATLIAKDKTAPL